MAKYVCAICGYEYDPAEGCPDQGIAPGTPWEEVPEDFVCPDLRRRQGSVRRAVMPDKIHPLCRVDFLLFRNGNQASCPYFLGKIFYLAEKRNLR